jgi:hypothetical protein
VLAKRDNRRQSRHDPGLEDARRERKLFASAITPDGMVNYLNTIVAPCTRRYSIEETQGPEKSTLIEKVKAAAWREAYSPRRTTALCTLKKWNLW